MSKLIINASNKKSKINKNIYGHFSEHLGRCIYEGLFVGEDSQIPNEKGMRCDVVEALKNIKIPVLRWPGGCFADEYHWKDGIGEKKDRKKMINTHWGGVVEDNSFGTHEFLELCSQLGCEPYINGNVGSGTVQEMSEWVEYMTSDCVSPMVEMRQKNGKEEPWSLKYFGVGNENWGCGGNMRPEFYADMYRRFQTYVRNYGENRIFKIACGPNVDDYRWMEKVMEIAGRYMNAITLHYYTVTGDTWKDKGGATGFSVDEYYKTLKKAFYMDELIVNHTQIMNRFDKNHHVGLIVDEWGTWHNVETGTNPGFLYQQNTMRDALVAAINLNIFNEHSDRVIMANIAQTVNVLQSVILTEGEKMVLTPTYHVFDLYKEHQDGTLIDSYLEKEEIGRAENKVPNLTSSVSEDKDGNLHITIANLSDCNSYPLVCNIVDKKVTSVSGRILTAPIGAYNDFEHADQVKVVNIDEISTTEQGFEYQIPSCSVAHFVVK